MTRFRFLAATLSLMLLLAPCNAWAQEAEPLGPMETQLFARQFKDESQEDRLGRLEKTIFGESQKGDAATRTRHLKEVLTVSAPMPEPTQSASQSGQDLTSEPTEEAAEPRPPEATDYPTVTALERQVLRQTYAGEDVATRLKRLEQQVFHQSYDELPMVDRVDQLTLKVMPGSALGVEEGIISGLPNRSSDFSGSNVAVYSQLTALEEQILGRTYGGDMLTGRLSRLEQQVFGASRVGSVDSRVEQLVAKYPSRIQQPQWQSPTARFQNPGNYRFGESANRINRAVGQSLSPEMVGLLPPNVRSQIQQGALPPPEQYDHPPQTYPAPSISVNQSTQLVPQQLFAPPQSLYQFPGSVNPQSYNAPRPTPVLPNSSAYGTPISALGQVLQPQPLNPPMGYPDQQPLMSLPPAYPQQPMMNGMVLPPAYPQQHVMPPQNMNMMGYGQPMMSAMGPQSSLIQSVSMLESQVFGQTYTNSTLIQRLNNLEKNVFGTTYPKYSPQQRINRLMNKATPQGALPGNPLNRLMGGKSGGKKPSIMQSAVGALMQGTILNSGFMNQAAQQDASYTADPYGSY